MYWDRFDIIMAHYVFYANWHSGQWSEHYARLCRIGKYFTPAPMGIDLNSEENENAREIYISLCDKHGFEVPSQIRL